MAKPATTAPKRLPETYGEYQLALAGKDYLNPKQYEDYGQRELLPGEVFELEPLPEHGWKVSVTVEAKGRSTKHWLHIENPLYGVTASKMNVNNWQSVTRGFKETYIRLEMNMNVAPATKAQVEAALALLLVYCKPKNLSDCSATTVSKMTDLGMFFVYDLWDKCNEVVDRSDWVDWSKYWHDRCKRAEEELEALKKGRRVVLGLVAKAVLKSGTGKKP